MNSFSYPAALCAKGFHRTLDSLVTRVLSVCSHLIFSPVTELRGAFCVFMFEYVTNAALTSVTAFIAAPSETTLNIIRPNKLNGIKKNKKLYEIGENTQNIRLQVWKTHFYLGNRQMKVHTQQTKSCYNEYFLYNLIKCWCEKWKKTIRVGPQRIISWLGSR